MKFPQRAMLLCALACVQPAATAVAQIHLPYTSQHRNETLAEEHLSTGRYALAADRAAAAVARAHADPVAQLPLEGIRRMHGYRAYAHLRLATQGAADSAKRVLRQSTSPAVRARLSLALAQHYFLAEQPVEAIPYYEAARIEHLSNTEIATVKFELAYCYFTTGRYAEAEPLFAAMKGLEGPYKSAGQYYYGLLAYTGGRYTDALAAFEPIAGEPQYRQIVPYYIAEIYYFTGDRPRALAEAQRLLREPEKLYYDTELNLLAAQVLFEEARYEDALPYFEIYADRTPKMRKEELYEMGYAYYRVSEWPEAISTFKPLSAAQDSLGQTAMYLLGDCYLKTGDKAGARAAFSLAADEPYNPALREDALLLSAKLAAEEGRSEEALSRIQTLLTQYPATDARSEALSLRSELFLRSARYADALATLGEVPASTPGYAALFTRASFGRAIETLREGDAAAADSLLVPLERAEAEDYAAAAIFWRADIAYRGARYRDALGGAQRFLAAPGRAAQVSVQATAAATRSLAGHAALQLEEWSAAEEYFRAAGTVGTIREQSEVRLADAVFMQRRYAQALPLYESAAAAGGSEAAYARYQSALVQGLLGRADAKAQTLQAIISTGGAYSAEARYELAGQRLAEDQPAEALRLLGPMLQSEGPLAPAAWLRAGVAYADAGNDSGALRAYSHILDAYPSSAERPAALEALRALYIEQGDPAGFESVVRAAGLSGAAGDAVLDSTFYAAAEAAYSRGEWRRAVDGLDAYLSRYPQGVFAEKARYYKGEGLYQLADYPAARKDFEAVLSGPPGAFTEGSAHRAATLAERARDTLAAGRAWRALASTARTHDARSEAWLGVARSADAVRADSTVSAALAAFFALSPAPPAARAEAYLLSARSALRTGGAGGARPALDSVVALDSRGVAGAEARYRIAHRLFEEAKLAEAERYAAESIRLSTGHTFWVERTYILLGEVLAKSGDFFNAKATLQSVVKGSRNAVLRKEAEEKLQAVLAEEKKGSKLSDE